ncbi:MAG: hypothetical protein GY829_13975 [Gammaproteobacteria bacterium]|nr:hypothetical protein [Gammaproteobacteria bacterium]
MSDFRKEDLYQAFKLAEIEASYALVSLHEVLAAEIESRDTRIKDLEKDISFYRSCLNCLLYSGKTPAPGDEPSAQYGVVSPPTIGATENDRDC